jgi:hypothetical protein
VTRNEILADIPRLKDLLPATKLYLWEHFFFTPIGADQLECATRLAQQISRISRGKKTRMLSENADVIGKVGEFVVRDFCEQYLTDGSWESYAERVNDRGGDITDILIHGMHVDVKTRQLHDDVTIAPSFDLRVPAGGDHYQDVFVLAGYHKETRYGYCFGWATWDELMSQPIRTDIRFPARCLPLVDLHPILQLEHYATRRALMMAKAG